MLPQLDPPCSVRRGKASLLVKQFLFLGKLVGEECQRGWQIHAFEVWRPSGPLSLSSHSPQRGPWAGALMGRPNLPGALTALALALLTLSLLEPIHHGMLRGAFKKPSYVLLWRNVAELLKLPPPPYSFPFGACTPEQNGSKKEREWRGTLSWSPAVFLDWKKMVEALWNFPSTIPLPTWSLFAMEDRPRREWDWLGALPSLGTARCFLVAQEGRMLHDWQFPVMRTVHVEQCFTHPPLAHYPTCLTGGLVHPYGCTNPDST